MKLLSGDAIWHVMACFMLGAKPLPEPTMTIYQLGPKEQTFMKLKSKYKPCFHENVFWKCQPFYSCFSALFDCGIWHTQLYNGHKVCNTPCYAKFILETSKFICTSRISWVKWHRLLKSFPVKDKGLIILHKQYHGISKHSISIICLEYYVLSTVLSLI